MSWLSDFGDSLEDFGDEILSTVGLGSPGIEYPEPTEEEKKLTKKQAELIDEQIKQLSRQNELLDKLWPSLEEYYKGQIDYSQLQLESARELLPLQTELAEQGIELNALELDAIKDQIERNAALEPLLLETIGFEKDEEGNYIPVEGEQDPLLATLEERYMGAIEGKEGVSPYLETQLEEERAKLEEDLSRRLGPNWRSTTPGIQAMEEFQSRADMLREEARQSTIASAGSQYLTARGLMAGEKQQKIGNIATLMGKGTAVTPVSGGTGTISAGGGMPSGLMGGSGASSVSAGLSDLRDWYQQQRYNKWSLQQGQIAGQKQAMFGGALGGAQIGAKFGPWGAAAGAGIGLLSGYLLS